MERRQFTREFKLEAVRLIKQRGVSYAQASKARPSPTSGRGGTGVAYGIAGYGSVNKKIAASGSRH